VTDTGSGYLPAMLNPFEPGFFDDPYAQYARVRESEPVHRTALTMRYLDGLPVPEVAALLDRTVHATEALLVRARLAFRRAYGSDTDRELRGEEESSA